MLFDWLLQLNENNHRVKITKIKLIIQGKINEINLLEKHLIMNVLNLYYQFYLYI